MYLKLKHLIRSTRLIQVAWKRSLRVLYARREVLLPITLINLIALVALVTLIYFLVSIMCVLETVCLSL